MLKVKICGITNLDDALAAVDSGADALGFVFYKGSPRHVPPDSVRDIIKKLPPFITTVGVFADESTDETEKIAQYASIDVIQLHGSETPQMCMLDRTVIKAIRVKELRDLAPLENYNVSAFLLDTYSDESLGGTGLIFNWDIAVAAKQFGRIILAGGLNPDNIQNAVRLVSPYAVDASSGVEAKKGKKDHGKMKMFIELAKSA